ncbi:MAG: MerR family transcriptional regulator [Actinomycetota bacterium]
MAAGRYRVEELAEQAGTSVDTIRYYQHRGLLAAPAREGRVAYYSDAHAERLQRIRELKDQGLSLATIGRLLSGSIHPADAALVTAVAETGARGGMTLQELADATGVAMPLLESLIGEGLLVPEDPEAERPFGPNDVAAVRAGLTLLEAGVPLSRLLELGRRHNSAMDAVAEEAVSIFDEFIRRPARDEEDPEQARDHVMQAFDRLLPAASALVRQSFERALLQAARRRIDESARTE